MSIYNTRVKMFPGRGLTYTFYAAGVRIGEERSPPKPDHQPGDPRLIELKARKRARSAVYDLARCNDWDWFLTLTLDPKRVDRWNYDACVGEMAKFADVMRKAGNQYIIVPEQHKSGAWHFHALVVGELKVEPATSYYTGELLFDKSGRQIYNIKNYKYGLNTATPVSHSARAAGYIAKYMVKEMAIPRGKKRYWASKSLRRPEIEYADTSVVEQDEIFTFCDFSKRINAQFGDLLICDYRSASENVDFDDMMDEIGFVEEEAESDLHDVFVQIDPRYTWEPLQGEQLEIEQNIN